MKGNRLLEMATFAKVAEVRNFQKAAMELEASAAVITRRVQELEAGLGIKLISRASRPLALTSAGEQYFRFCRDTLQAIEQEESALRSLQRDPSGKLTIVVPVSLGAMLLARAQAEFARLHPDISLKLVLADHWNETFDPKDYRADVLIRATRPKKSSLQSRRLGTFSWVVCATPDYLERHGAPNHPNELAAHSCLIPNRPFSEGIVRFRQGGAVTSLRVSGSVAPSSAIAMLLLVRQGHGIAILPRFCVRQEIESGVLTTILDGYALAEQPIWAYHGYGLRPPLRIQLFLNFLSAWMRANRPF